MQLPVSSLEIKYSNNFKNLIIKFHRFHSLPEEFGSLPLLGLDLSYNNLGRSNQFVWECLMQAPIRNNLQELDISRNSVSNIEILNNSKYEIIKIIN